MKLSSWILFSGLVLVGAAFLIFGILRKLEKDQLFLLEESMKATAEALQAPSRACLVDGADLHAFEDLLVTTQDATGSRIRIFSEKRELVADSLYQPQEEQSELRFRPEIQAAFVGRYGAYTRLADENVNSLALFLALPVTHEGQIVGAVYVSHTTDEILHQLGLIRRSTSWVILVLAFITFLGSLVITGRLLSTLVRIKTLTGADGTDEIEVEGDGELAEIGQNFNRLIQSLREKVAELEEERTKTKHFLEDVAHELKTPITGLSGSVEALLDSDTKKDDQKRLLKNVEKETDRLAELTGRLLELQKLEYTSLQKEDFDLVSVAETVTDTFSGKAHKKAVSLAIEGTDSLTAFGDIKKIQRVVENLVDNAIRCSPEEGVVTLRLAQTEDGAQLSVEDEGPGPPDLKLLKRNAQGAKFPGSLGLGLSIASEILHLHEKELEVLPGSPAGSIFRFQLDLTQN